MFRGLTDVSTGAKRLMRLMLVAAVGACADSQITAPEHPLIPGPLADIVVDPLDPSTETHTFDELSATCSFGDVLPNPYEGLTFETTPYFTACGSGVSPNGTVVLVPSLESAYGSITEIRIDLPKPAVAASLDVYDLFTDRDLTLNAYDGAGNLVASASDPTDGAWVTLSVSGDIRSLGIATDQGNTFLDNLSITYAPDTPDGPVDTDACKKGGWSAFGFRNQGQCVRLVETGKDKR